jgi:alanyl-tRNA synthetase
MAAARLYYDEPGLCVFEATVTGVQQEGRVITLDRTAFYPLSGGQLPDRGVLAGCVVEDVQESGEEIEHHLAVPFAGEVGQVVRGEVDPRRRHDHRQQHTGQHLLSAVLAEEWKVNTVSFHMGEAVCTIDIDRLPWTAEELAAVERTANEQVWQGRAVKISYEDAVLAQGLRKASERSGVLRIVEIDGLDRSACGGTHVENSGQCGPIFLGRTEKVRQMLRLEFYCGARALRHMRQQSEGLERIAKLLQTGADKAPSTVRVQMERLLSLEKELKLQTAKLAQYEAKQCWQDATVGADGVRRCRVECSEIGERERQLLTTFCAEGPGLALAYAPGSGAVLLASSAQGVAAGQRLQMVMSARGGKGGGAAAMAQGRAPLVDEALIAELLR